MAAPSAANRPSPERIFNTLNAYQETAALRTAIELDIFTAIGKGANTVATLASQTKAAERGVRILCDFLTIQGFLTKDEGRYSLTPESAVFLDRRSPACLASMSQFLGNEWSKRNFETLTQAVRKGGAATDTGDNLKPNDEVWVQFARSMAPLMGPGTEFIATLVHASDGRPCKVLDIAAGHGMYGITIAKKNPKAEIVALDWPKVVEVAQENARNAGVADRYTVRAGSAFETPFGTGYDYVLLTNIFHHFDVPTCETLMKRVHSALTPGGKAVTMEFVPEEDRVSPRTAAAFALIMLANTDGGDAYTFSEYEKMFRSSGFASTTIHPVPDMPQQVLISEKN